MNKYEHGGYKTCPACGKTFYVIEPELWAYKHEGHIAGADKREFLCSWSCLRKHEKNYQKKKDEAIREASERARIKKRERLKSVREEYADKHCDQCRYFSEGKFGFTDCSVISRPIRGTAMACRRYKGRYDYEDDD